MYPPILQFLILTVAAWLARRQQNVIEYLLEENRFYESSYLESGCASPTHNAAGWQ